MLVFISNLLKVVYDIKELVDSAQNRKLELHFDYHTQIPWAVLNNLSVVISPGLVGPVIYLSRSNAF